MWLENIYEQTLFFGALGDSGVLRADLSGLNWVPRQKLGA